MGLLYDNGAFLKRSLRVAQLGRAPAWGAGGRWFKSSRADQFLPYHQQHHRIEDEPVLTQNEILTVFVNSLKL